MATTKKSAKAAKGLENLFLDGLKDLYYAEKKILRTLPKMAKSAESDEVSAAFEKHRAETEKQVERLEQVFELMDKPARGKTCPAIDGIIEEGSEILEEYKGAPAIDAGLVAAAQSVEHYEIARYGTLVAWAQQLGMNDAVSLLKETLAEEENTDKALTKLGESGVNERAMRQAA
jgi:ferritin-like metal-binding protein YciE